MRRCDPDQCQRIYRQLCEYDTMIMRYTNLLYHKSHTDLIKANHILDHIHGICPVIIPVWLVYELIGQMKSHHITHITGHSGFLLRAINCLYRLAPMPVASNPVVCALVVCSVGMRYHTNHTDPLLHAIISHGIEYIVLVSRDPDVLVSNRINTLRPFDVLWVSRLSDYLEPDSHGNAEQTIWLIHRIASYHQYTRAKHQYLLLDRA